MFENRRSHRRLACSMGLSSVFIAVLLGGLTLLLDERECGEFWCFDESGALTVRLRQLSTENVSEIEAPKFEKRTGPRVVTTTATKRNSKAEQSEAIEDQEYALIPPSDQTPIRDWYAIAEDPIGQTIDEYFENEEVRKQMWRQTGSVMFEDTGEFDFQEPATIIAAREFRVPVGVLGIGITIGGCFFGIPLAGIPVDERGAGPNVIYCTDIYE